jgi:hypothetical protein
MPTREDGTPAIMASGGLEGGIGLADDAGAMTGLVIYNRQKTAATAVLAESSQG